MYGICVPADRQDSELSGQAANIVEDEVSKMDILSAWSDKQANSYSGIGQRLTFSTVSVRSATIGSAYVMIISNIDCNIAVGLNPVATATTTIIPSRTMIVLRVGVGNKIAILPIVVGSLLGTTFFYVNELL